MILLIGLGILGLSSEVSAMGSAPTTCTNRYDGTITSFIISNGTQTFDAIANPGVTFDVNAQSHYNVTFVIYTENMSSQGNTALGTTWYNQDLYDFQMGTCVPSSNTPSIGPNQNVTVSLVNIGNPKANYSPTYTQAVGFNTFVNGINYNVHWIVTSSSLTVDTQATNGTAITGYYTQLSQNGATIATGFTPTTFTLNSGQTYSLVVDGYGNCVFDHWLDTGNTSNARTVSITSNTTLTAVLDCSALTVQSTDLMGNPINGYYVTLYDPSIINSTTGYYQVVATGYTPTTFLHLIPGHTYIVEADGYGTCAFVHWDDGSTNNQRTFTAGDSAQTFTAVYGGVC
jgi:hypothetical protein